MKYYHIDIVVTEEEVRILKEEFDNYIQESGGFVVTIHPDNYAEASPELEEVLRKMFFNFVMTVNFGRFTGVN